MKNREYFKFDETNPKHIEQKQKFWVRIDGKVPDVVPLKKSRPVGLIDDTRRMAISASRGAQRKSKGDTRLRDTPHLDRDARINTKTGGVLDKGIQLHRYWFQYLKLALELETLGRKVELCTHQALINKVKRTGGRGGRELEGIPPSLKGVGLLSRSRNVVRVKVNRSKYKGWHLDQVLKDPFDKWWKTHSYLFEGQIPSFIDSKDDWDDSKFLYLKIDKSSKRGDVHNFLRDKLKNKLSDEGRPLFQIEGTPRPDQLQNRYNALVLTLNPIVNGIRLSDGQKCEHERNFFRAPDERSHIRLAIPTRKNKQGNKVPKPSILLGEQREGGMHHLVDVMSGHFGKAPPNKK